MTYPKLPQLGTIAAPPLAWRASPNCSSRNGIRPHLIFVHTWGGGSFDSVTAWLCNPQPEHPERRVSAHVVYGGTDQATQLVRWSDKAWTESTLNPVGISVESADAIWNGHDPEGFAQLARLVALLCHLHLDGCRYVTAQGIVAGMAGFTRHADAGALGGGHTSCPTADLALWRQFAGRVVAEYRYGGFRDRYGKG